MSFPHPAPFIPVEYDARTDFVYSTDGKKSLLSYKVRRGGVTGKSCPNLAAELLHVAHHKRRIGKQYDPTGAWNPRQYVRC